MRTVMQKYLLAGALLTFSSAFFYACTQESQPAEKAPVTENVSAEKFPNPSSELSLLMRDMYADAEVIKTAILENKLPDDFREKFKNIHTASPTDDKTKKESFGPMSESFLRSLDKVYEDSENQVENFNIMVQNCIACHTSHCPGPISRIKKLTIAVR
jgi:hypothetical protein